MTTTPHMQLRAVAAVVLATTVVASRPSRAEGPWEVTPASEAALELGLEWLARNQGPEGNWESDDLGLVGLGALAFLAAGHMPGRGAYGTSVERALDYVVRAARPSGLLNIAQSKRDMYNHGLATFVLGQAYGMTGDARLSSVLDRALKLIAATQCEDGGWDYNAERQRRGHDLSLAVMQAKALRSAMDCGLEVPPDVVTLSIRSVREHYKTRSGRRGFDEAAMRREPGQFTYDGSRETLAMAACGVVCLQEFGQYDDWRIPRNMDVIRKEIQTLAKQPPKKGEVPFDAYTLYYVGQSVYQVGGREWSETYPLLRDAIVASQERSGEGRRRGSWRDGKRVGSKPGELFGTAVACFVLAIPNRYLPILQEGKINSLEGRFRK